MKLEWVTPAVYDAVGAIALAVIGFSWGGWITSATRMADDASVTRSSLR